LPMAVSKRVILISFLILSLLAGCMPPDMDLGWEDDPYEQELTPEPTPTEVMPTPLPTREPFLPGTLVDYTAQTGDTLEALAVRFNTTVQEIREANPIIPNDTTTMPPGMPMQIPIYYQPAWGTPYQIIPDSLFINGPAQIGFDAGDFVREQPGWLKNYKGYFDGKNLSGGDLVAAIGEQYSVSPRLLLALVEYYAGGLTDPEPRVDVDRYPLGYRSSTHQGLTNQLIWTANKLNNGYYAFRLGRLTSLDLPDGRLVVPDPWQNAATVALHNLFTLTNTPQSFDLAVSGEGFARTYRELFGDPWANVEPHIPASLHQPVLTLPFRPGHAWAYTGGPHTGWGTGLPFSAVDFAPPSTQSGCAAASEPATAVADGVIARRGDASLWLDLDGDGDIRTGWVVFYLHLANSSLAPLGKEVKAGDPLGLPSCEGGSATGTHVHIARMYNGEWIPAGSGVLAFQMDGWVAVDGEEPYKGFLVRYGEEVRASTGSDRMSHISASAP